MFPKQLQDELLVRKSSANLFMPVVANDKLVRNIIIQVVAKYNLTYQKMAAANTANRTVTVTEMTVLIVRIMSCSCTATVAIYK